MSFPAAIRNALTASIYTSLRLLILFEEVIDFVKNSSAGKVYLGGAEPTLQKDLIPLIEELHTLGKHILLKSNGMKPELLESALPFVDGFVLEIKAPLCAGWLLLKSKLFVLTLARKVVGQTSSK